MALFFCFNDTQKVSSGYLLGIVEQNDTGRLRKTECQHFVSILYRLLCFCNELSKYTRKIHGGLYMLGKAQGQGHTACEMKLSAKPNSGNALTHRLYMAEKKSTHK
jgi:hypothetical protein